MWSYYLIIFIIIFNNILLNLLILIALIYHFYSYQIIFLIYQNLFIYY